MADMVRELAENPNVHQPVLDGWELYLERLGFEPIACLDRLIDRLV